MQDKKSILAKLMNLDNKKADIQLANFGIELFNNIKNTKNNDKIFEYLDLLDQFIYKVPDTALEIINHILARKHPTPIHKSKFGELEGKKHDQLVEKCVELLRKIRYIKPDQVFELLAGLVLTGTGDVKSKAKEALKRQSQYDMHALKAIGYSVQRMLLDKILSWNKDKRLSQVEVIEIVTEELLEPSFEGTTMTDEITLTLHSGSLQPTDFLKKIRKETIDLLFSLFNQSSDDGVKIRLLHLMDNVSNTPRSVAYGDDVADMVKADIEYLVRLYSQVLFGSEGKLNPDFAIVKEIDHRLGWLSRGYKDKIPEILALLNKVKQDPDYNMFRLFVGDITEYKDDDNWQAAEQERKSLIEQQLQSITQETLGQWIPKLNQIAKFGSRVEDWKFQEFRIFLERFSETKPDLAGLVLNDAFDDDKFLKQNFLIQFLAGFRKGSHVTLWDKYVQKILEKPDVKLVSAICFSLMDAKNEELRTKDISLLEDMIMRQEMFSFLQGEANLGGVFHHASINALYHAYLFDPKRIEQLIVYVLNQRSNYTDLYIRELDFAQWRKKINFEGWEKSSIDVLVKKLIQLPTLEHHDQVTLWNLGKHSFDCIAQVFLGRIEKVAAIKEVKRKIGQKENRYDAIPYHINPELQQFVAQHPKYPDFIRACIKQMSVKWSIFDWEVGQLLRSIRGPIREVLIEVIRTGKRINLRKALRIIGSIESPDLELCFEIVKQTDDIKIWNSVESAMYATGVVSGEFGIAVAHERKAEEAKAYLEDKNPRAKKFAKKVIKDFTEMAKKERQSSEEDIKKRKLEFEG
jgi:hypothetical protein